MPRAGSKEALEAEITKLKRELAELRADQRPPSDDVVGLGPAPTDPLELQSYAARAHAILIREVMTDPAMTPAQRRRETRALTAGLSKLIPKSRIYEAEQLIKGDRAELERKKGKGATLEKAPTPARPSPKPKS